MAGSLPRPFFRRGTTLRIISASTAVRVILSFDLARIMALDTRLDSLSSPYVYIMSANSASLKVFTICSAVTPSEPIRMSSGPSNLKEKPRSGLSICGEETPKSRTTASTESIPRLDKSTSISPKQPWLIENLSPNSRTK